MADKIGYDVVIDGGDDKISFGGKYVTFVEFNVDTLEEHVEERSHDIYCLLTIKGKIQTETKDETRKLAIWSLDDANKKIYRKVVVECYPGGEILRKYVLDKAFCVDYKETLGTSGNDGIFELKIAQRKNNLDTVVINS